MLVEDIEIDSVDLLVVEKGDSFEIPKWNDRNFLPNEQSLSLLQKLFALLRVGLHIAIAQELIVAFVFPPSAIVAVVAHPQVQEGVSIVVIANPGAGREV